MYVYAVLVEGFKKEKILSDTSLSFWILPPQIPVGNIGDWTATTKTILLGNGVVFVMWFPDNQLDDHLIVCR